MPENEQACPPQERAPPIALTVRDPATHQDHTDVEVDQAHPSPWQVHELRTFVGETAGGEG